MRSTKDCGSISAGWTCSPCPAPSPRYSTAYDLAAAYQARRDAPRRSTGSTPGARPRRSRPCSAGSIDRDPLSSFLLIRSSLFDRYARELAGRVIPVFRESGLSRNELVLLRADGRTPLAASDQPTRR